MSMMGIRGEITTDLFLSDGTLLHSETKTNNIVNVGIRAIARAITGVEPVVFATIQVGTGGEEYVQLQDPETGALLFKGDGSPIMGDVFRVVPDADTALFAYYAETSDVTKTVETGAFTLKANMAIPLDVGVNEAGIFSGPHLGAPKMLAKQVFSNTMKLWKARQAATLSTVVGDTITLAITWKIFFSRDPQYEALYDPDLLIVSEV
jgi:hypothetical protein